MPQMIGKYRTIATLGRGGMAEVFLTVAEGPFDFNKLLVVKRLRPDLVDDEYFQAMFLDEARLAAHLNHPNIVQTYEVGSDGKGHFIAMEYLDGQPLVALLRRLQRKIPLGHHLTILAHVLSALDYAHALQNFDGKPLSIVHRDVSPQNVIITYEGQVKLVDFGVAKSTIAVAETQAGVLKGKAGYMAPEQVAQRPLDGRADLFAVGVMLWEALAERRLNAPDQDSARVLVERLKGEHPSLNEVSPNAPAELVRICERAMKTDPDERYATAAEMRVEIDAYLDKNGLRAPPHELASLMRDAFAEERSAMQRRVTEQLARVERGESSGAIEVPRWGSGSGSGERTPASEVHDSSRPTSVQPVDPSYKRPAVIALGVVGVAAVAAGVVFLRGDPASSETTPAEATATVASAPAGEAPAPTPEASSDGATTTSEATSDASSAPSASASASAPATKAAVPSAGPAAQRPIAPRPTTRKPDDRVFDLPAQPAKPRRQLDEKDPYE